LGRYLLEKNIAACVFQGARPGRWGGRPTHDEGVVDVELSSPCSPLSNLGIPHVTCRQQQRLVALVAIEGVRRREGSRMAIRHADLKSRFRDPNWR
jgi:hypothetical protein